MEAEHYPTSGGRCLSVFGRYHSALNDSDMWGYTEAREVGGVRILTEKGISRFKRSQITGISGQASGLLILILTNWQGTLLLSSLCLGLLSRIRKEDTERD